MNNKLISISVENINCPPVLMTAKLEGKNIIIGNITLPITDPNIARVLGKNDVDRTNGVTLKGAFLSSVTLKEIRKAMDIVQNLKPNDPRSLAVVSDVTADVDWNDVLKAKNREPGIYIVLCYYMQAVTGNLGLRNVPGVSVTDSFNGFTTHREPAMKGPSKGTLFMYQDDLKEDTIPVFLGIFRINNEGQALIRATLNVDVKENDLKSGTPTETIVD